VGRVYAGQTANERAGTRRRQFLDAGLEVIGTHGWSGSTVRGVCEQAGLSTRYFYESFASLQELALALYDELVDDLFRTAATAVLTAATAATDRVARTQAGVGALVDWLLQDPRRAQLLLVAGSGQEPLAERRAHTMQRLTDTMAQFGTVEYGGVVGSEELVRITATLVAGGLAEVTGAWLDGRLTVERDALVRYCSVLIVGIGDTARETALADGDGAQRPGEP
jgi:AcrR family transcriptional regulator